MKVLTLLIGIGIFVFAAYYAVTAYIEQAPQGGAPILPLRMADGEYFGFIHGVVPNLGTLVFDDAVWLTGLEAQDAAIAAGLCTEETREECAPNDYFIQNDTAKDEPIFIDGNARVLMQTFQMEETGMVEGREIALGEFATLINDPAQHWHLLPYRITVLHGTIILIEEVYVP